MKKFIFLILLLMLLFTASTVFAVTLLPVPQGGTGQGSFTAGYFLLGSGAGGLGEVSSSTYNQTVTYVNQDVTIGSSPTFLTPTISGLVWDGVTLATSSEILDLWTTTNLDEGGNLYFTNARADARINATSTIGTLTSAPNLSITESQISDLDHYDVLDFAGDLAGTSTDALSEGSNNLYWTITRFDNRLSASSSIDGINTLNNLSTIGSGTGFLYTTSGALISSSSISDVYIDNDITASNYLLLSGGTINGSLTVTGNINTNGLYQIDGSQIVISDLGDASTTDSTLDINDILAWDGSKFVNVKADTISISGITNWWMSSTTSDILGIADALSQPATTSEQTITVTSVANTRVLIKEFITATGTPGVEIISAGAWHFPTYASVDSDAGVAQIAIDIYDRDPDGVETYITSATTTEINGSSALQYGRDVSGNALETDIDHRTVFRYYAYHNQNNRNITLYVEGITHPTHIHTEIGVTHNLVGGIQGGDASLSQRYHLSLTKYGYIDQDVTSGSSPTFDNANITGNISVYTNNSGYLTSISAYTLGSLSDVSTSTLEQGFTLTYDGSNWTSTSTIFITSDEKVGIGTTSVGLINTWSPSGVKLHIDNSSGDNYIAIGAAGTAAGIILNARDSTADAKAFLMFSGSDYFGIEPHQDDGTPNCADCFVIASDGNLGLGGTTSPGSVLSIHNIANFTISTSTLYGAGINLEDGCFAVNGTCLIDTDTNANTICSGTGNYLDGEGNCDALLTNATHSSEVTGAGALTIASNVVDEDNLLIGAPTDLYIMMASSSADGGWEWIATSSPLLGFGTGGAGGGETLAQTLALGADGNAVTQTNLGVLQGVDAQLYLDMTGDGVIDLTSDGTLELHSADWDISVTGVMTGFGNITSNGTILAVIYSIGDASVDETELEILDGATVTTTQVNYINTLSSNAQDQLDGKSASFSTLTALNALLPGETIASTTWAGANSIVIVGALNSGSITSGFGNIDIGSSNIDADGTVTFNGVVDAGGATSLKIPNAANPAVTIKGQIALDDTDNQLLIATTSGVAVIPTMIKLFGGGLSSTSPDFINGGRQFTTPHRDGFTVREIHCIADGGTSVVINFSNSAGTTDSETITCDTNGQADTNIGTNPSYAAGSFNSIEIGAITGAVDHLTWSVWGHIHRE